ncbi:MAG: biotin/lipoate A/B protein ligase family protein [Candidatus Altiarchaeota archaeon]|nr:biotin/lipoate A/B protein ligase family protein [Candidatus Altiarchaeota archaeon]
MNFRLLETGFDRACVNMGIDESILKHVSEGSSQPTVRLYGWKPPAVSIGYFQGLEEEVDLEACRSLGVDYVRRITGGGAVYHDMELTYSFIAREDYVPKDMLESYKMVCGGLVAGLGILGIEAEFAPLNDIVTGGRKISGNAQTRRMGCVLQHGTILLDVDVERMFALLKVPSEKMRDKLVKNVKDRVTSVNGVLGREIRFEEASQAFATGFSKSLGIKLSKGILSESELDLAYKIAEEKYNSRDWNFKR